MTAPRADDVDWAALSERSQATLRVCWSHLLLGYETMPDLAQQTGVAAPTLTDALNQLSEELQAQKQ